MFHPQFLFSTLQYDPEGRLIVVDISKEKGERVTDISKMAYYMEKDVRRKQYLC